MSDIEQDKFNYDFGIRLEASRMALELTPNDMCEVLSVARSTYTQYIRGHSMIAPHRLVKLYRKGISADYLFFGDDRFVPESLARSLRDYEQAARIEREKPEGRGRRS